MRVGSHRATQLANRHLFARGLQPLFGPAEFVVHQRHLQPEGNRLRMNAMAAANHRRFLILARLLADRLPQFGDIFQKNVTRADKLDRKRGIENVR